MNIRSTVSGLVVATAGLLSVSTHIAVAEQGFSFEPIVPEQSAGVEFVNPATPRSAPASQPAYVEASQPNQTEILDNYGLIKAAQGNQVSVRLLTGETKTYLLASNAEGASVRQGSLVGFETNSKGNITRLSPPQVQRIYRGTLIIVEDQKIGMVTPEGERFVTTLSKAKIARMGLAPGQPIKITQYKGTWATKVCQPGARNDDDAQPIIADQSGISLGGPIAPQGQ
ncbi:MAG: hypothetical protein ACFCU8_09165 [Thermosynechococcaceae cyanobacterium]